MVSVPAVTVKKKKKKMPYNAPQANDPVDTINWKDPLILLDNNNVRISLQQEPLSSFP